VTLQSDSLQTIDPPRQKPQPAKPTDEPAPAAAATDVLVQAVNLGKRFKIYPRPSGRLVEWLSAGRAKRHQEFWALRDVSFDVRRGECLGVIGPNGSGKSTLLKLLSGAMYPTCGTFRVTGRVLSLLELGTGLTPEMTGRQNVVQSTRLLALGPEYAAEKMPQIEEFAELGDFFDRPVRLYSSGMLVRLVFSMFACFDPDVFIVDEALSVGDIHFQQKSVARVRQMLASGVTMLFVSHDLAVVESLCDRVMVLHGGRVQHLGDKAAGIRKYYAISGASQPSATTHHLTRDTGAERGTIPSGESTTLSPDDLASLRWQPPLERDALGDERIRVTGVCYRREPDGGDEPVVEQNRWVDLFGRFEAATNVGPVNIGVSVLDRLGRLVFARGWVNGDVEPLHLAKGQQVVARFRLRADLEPGEYSVGLAAAEPLRDAASPNGWNQHTGGARYVELPHASKLAVLPRADGRRLNYGPANLPSEFAFAVSGPGATP
jgi:lipopolysaccharide transport system ATP-binding protein